MQEVYASLLLHDAKQPITIENIKKILQSIGTSPDEGKLKALVASLEGQNIDELISQAVTVASAAPVKEEKKEDKKEDEAKSAEEAAAGLSSLFG